MRTGIDLKSEVIHRFVYELRYDLGQVYWDRAGRIAKKLLSALDEWDCESIGFNVCRLVQRRLNLTFNFGPAKLDLSQTQNTDVETLVPAGEFGKLAESVSSTVVENLELEFFPRIGFRAWHLYGASDRKQSEQLVRDLGLFRLDSNLERSLGEISEISHRLTIDQTKHMLRIAVAPFEQEVDVAPSLIRAAKARARDHNREQKKVMLDRMKAEKKIKHYPQFGVLLDLDAYIEDPPYPDDLGVSDFIAAAFDDFGKVKQTVLTTVNT